MPEERKCGMIHKNVPPSKKGVQGLEGVQEKEPAVGGSMKTNEHKSVKKYTRLVLLVFLDIIAVSFSTFFALFMRFDFSVSNIPKRFLEPAFGSLWLGILLTLLLFWAWRLYKSVWRYASANELVNIILGVCSSCIVTFILYEVQGINMPRSFIPFYGFSLLGCTCAIRFGYRLFRMVNRRRQQLIHRSELVNVMVIGAGAAGNAILKEIESTNYLSLKVCCLIDDSEGCHGKMLRGVPIVGGRGKIKEAVKKYDIHEIIIAIPSAKPSQVGPIIDICKDTGCKLRILPAIYQLINGEVSVSKLREVQIEDLLGRDPAKVNIDEIIGYVKDQKVLVTGGGGSIGSELCRQIAAHQPKQLLILDIYENSVYDIQQELKTKHPELDLKVLIASVRNEKRLEAIFKEYRPDIVYHAAAHKHVPLMEDSPNEAIKNNVFGTYKTAKMADLYQVKRFVMISTDKAVNPTNIMGASKRICEMIVQMMSRRSKTKFVAVRFGNVLGSNGSVIPLFKSQIASGGPVTVTDPEIIRYFMTIPEAVSLVLQAGAYAKGGEIFVLNMGEPVKIYDLAVNLIKLSGYRVGEDIEIVFTGLRPGEKMYEELLMSEEGLQSTQNNLIHIGKPIEFDEERFQSQLLELEALVREERPGVREKVSEIVSTYSFGEERK